MVQIFQITGIASAATTAISLGAFTGRGRIAVLTALRVTQRRSIAGAAHSHAASGHTHSHTAFLFARSNVAYSTVRAAMHSAGSMVTSGAGGVNPVTQIITTTPKINSATENRYGITSTGYTIDSNGRYVDTTTHPATLHANLKPHGSAGPRIEIGDAVRAGDLIQVVALMLSESGGVF